MLRCILAFFIGVTVGQYAMRYAYNPDDLERHALAFGVQSHYFGCLKVLHDEKICNDNANAYFIDVEPIWHNVAWKKI